MVKIPVWLHFDCQLNVARRKQLEGKVASPWLVRARQTCVISELKPSLRPHTSRRWRRQYCLILFNWVVDTLVFDALTRQFNRRCKLRTSLVGKRLVEVVLVDTGLVVVDNWVGLFMDSVVRKMPRWLTPQVQLLQGLVLLESVVRYHKRAACFVFALAVCERRVDCFGFYRRQLLVVERRH